MGFATGFGAAKETDVTARRVTKALVNILNDEDILLEMF